MNDSDKKDLAGKLQAINDAMPMALVYGLVNAVILSLVYWHVEKHPIVWAWLGLLLLVTAARSIFLLVCNRAITGEPEVSTDTLSRYMTITVAGVLLAGAVWGGAAFLLYVHEQKFEVFLAFVLGGISAGAITTLFSHRLASVGFLTLCLLPLAIHLISHNAFISQVMGLMMLLFYTGMVVSAMRAYKSYVEHLRIAGIASAVPEMQKQISVTTGMLDGRNRLLENYIGMLRQKSDAIIGFDLAMNINYWDPGAEKLFGFTAGEAMGKSTAMLCVDKEHVQLNEQLVKTLVQNDFVEIDLELRNRSGSRFYSRLSIILVRRDNGDPESAIAYLADIDELKKTEIALQQSERQYKSVVESLPMGMFIFDLAHNGQLVFTGYNEEANRILDVDCRQYIGRDIMDCFPALAGTDIPDKFREVINSGKPWLTDQFVYNNEDVNTAFMVNVFCIAENRVAAMFADVTERIEAERAIKDSESRLNFLLTSSPVVIYTSKASGDFGATYISPNIKDLFGFEPEQFTTNSQFWGNNIHPDDRERVFSGLDALFKHGKHTHEYRFLMANGEYRWMHDELRLIRHGDSGPDEIIGYWVDVTERVMAEQFKDEFIATVSHELRTPLTSIHGALGLVKGGATGSLDQKMLEMINIASNNSERLLLLINDILDIQRLDGKQTEFFHETISLYPWLEKVLQDNRPFADECSVGFLLDKSNEDIVIDVDPARLSQVMTNLLSNAIKFSPAGGIIKIRLRQEGGYARVSVADNGPGVPESFAPHLFDRFTQADRTNTRHHTGTGLGLNIAKNIIVQLGGEIGYEPGANGGSVFWFSLPVSRVSATSRQDSGQPGA